MVGKECSGLGNLESWTQIETKNPVLKGRKILDTQLGGGKGITVWGKPIAIMSGSGEEGRRKVWDSVLSSLMKQVSSQPFV